jgi:hypothetical protein
MSLNLCWLIQVVSARLGTTCTILKKLVVADPCGLCKATNNFGNLERTSFVE